MKAILSLFVLIMVISCGAAKSKWDEPMAKQNCVYSFVEGPEAAVLDSLVGRKNIYKICDCVIEQAVDLYDDEEAMLKDDKNFSELISACLDKVKAELGK